MDANRFKVHPSGVTSHRKIGASTSRIIPAGGDDGEPGSYVHPHIPGWFSEYSPLWPGGFT